MEPLRAVIDLDAVSFSAATSILNPASIGDGSAFRDSCVQSNIRGTDLAVIALLYFPTRRQVGRERCNGDKETTMDLSERTRRSFLKQFGAAGAAALAVANADGLGLAQSASKESASPQPAPTAADLKQAATREARMAWWHEARFGMFIHWGLYSIPAGKWDGKPVPGIGEWIMNRGSIPVADYKEIGRAHV